MKGDFRIRSFALNGSRAKRLGAVTIAVSAGVALFALGGISAMGAQADLPTPPVTAPIEEVPPPPTPESPSATPPSDQKSATPGKARFRTLKVGRRGADVQALQRKLRSRKHRIAVDGVFGKRTRLAVKRQQKRFNMPPTGVAEPNFQRKLRLTPVWTPGGAFLSRATGLLSVFPVTGNYTYTDDFGDPRHQGAHEGIDIMAPEGTPIVAAVSGTIDRLSRVETGLGGKWIWQRDSRGNEYYYAHLHTVAKGLEEGGKVTAGQVIATVGETGDARGTTPHLHMEVHPGGGSAVNFYADLVSVDPLQRTVSGKK